MTGKTPVYVTASGSVLRKPDDTASKGSDITKKAGASGYRLPTAVEWEYAARGGNPADTVNWNYEFAGGDDPSVVAVYLSTETAVAGSKASNGLGLYDMTGNIAELTDTRYSSGTNLFILSYGGNWELSYSRVPDYTVSLLDAGSATDVFRLVLD
jgi:formylglycine-generating enzyme required for sulfatase activity